MGRSLAIGHDREQSLGSGPCGGERPGNGELHAPWSDAHRIGQGEDGGRGVEADGGIGHCLINRTQRDAVYIEVGTRRANDTVVYSDIDMRLERDKNGSRYLHKTGEPYSVRKV